MKLAERILRLLNEPRTTKEIQQAIPDKHSRCLAATISNNLDVFLRLDKGLVGLVGRDEPLVRRTELLSKYALYKKIVNLLVGGHLALQQIYSSLPQEKEISIRATICMRKDLFITAKQGHSSIVGRKNRDEELLARYKPKEKSIKERDTTIAEALELILGDGPKTLAEICCYLPTVPKKSITCKLSLSKKFERVRKGVWKKK